MINHVNKDAQEPPRQKRKKEPRLGRVPSLWKPKASEAHKTEAAVKVTAQNLGINKEGLRPRAHAGEQKVTVNGYL